MSCSDGGRLWGNGGDISAVWRSNAAINRASISQLGDQDSRISVLIRVY